MGQIGRYTRNDLAEGPRCRQRFLRADRSNSPRGTSRKQVTTCSKTNAQILSSTPFPVFRVFRTSANTAIAASTGAALAPSKMGAKEYLSVTAPMV